MSERLNRYVNSKRVKIRVIELGLTNVQVAERMEIEQTTLYRHLSGTRPSSFTFMAGLAKVLETSIEDLSLPPSSEEDPPPEAA